MTTLQVTPSEYLNLFYNGDLGGGDLSNISHPFTSLMHLVVDDDMCLQEPDVTITHSTFQILVLNDSYSELVEHVFDLAASGDYSFCNIIDWLLETHYLPLAHGEAITEQQAAVFDYIFVFLAAYFNNPQSLSYH